MKRQKLSQLSLCIGMDDSLSHGGDRIIPEFKIGWTE